MKQRYLSLDVLRGITVTFMCIVNNPGSWGKVFAPLRHAPWVGCTPTDLVYPFFIFCAGCAMAFSFSKYDGFSKEAVMKVIRRGLGIFLVGFLINLYPFFPLEPHDASASFWQNYGYWLANKRIMGVLQRIGLSYLIAGLLALWLRKPAKILGAIGVLMAVYTGILVLFGTDPGPFTLEGTISRKIDVALLGEQHVYHGYRFADGTRAAFDPEGFLGSLTGACSCLLGFLIGSMILRSSRRHAADPSAPKDAPSWMVSRIFVYGCISLAAAMVMSIWIPICKPLWSASYVLYAGGWAMLALAFLAFCIDLCGIRKPFVGFEAMGSNALLAFVLSGVIAKSYAFFNFSPSEYFGANEYTSLAYALLFAAVIFCCLYPLYRKKIYIRL